MGLVFKWIAQSSEVQLIKEYIVFTTFFLSYKFQIKTRLLRINQFTHIQSFKIVCLYIRSWDIWYLFIVKLFPFYIVFFSWVYSDLCLSGKWGTNVSELSVYCSKGIGMIKIFLFVFLRSQTKSVEEFSCWTTAKEWMLHTTGATSHTHKHNMLYYVSADVLWTNHATCMPVFVP
jgi:hypothetical protein